jgi:Family of unknown function (DUF6525)
MSNSKGNHYCTPESDMRAYDKLPPTARQALQQAAFDWAAGPLLRRWNNARPGYKNGREIAKTIAAWDKNKVKNV